MTGVSEGGGHPMRQDAVCRRAQTAGSRRGRIYGRCGGRGGEWRGAWPDPERELTEWAPLSTCCRQASIDSFFPPPPSPAGLHPHTHEGQDVRLPQSAEPGSTRRRQEGDEDHLVSSPDAAPLLLTGHTSEFPPKMVSIQTDIFAQLVLED